MCNMKRKFHTPPDIHKTIKFLQVTQAFLRRFTKFRKFPQKDQTNCIAFDALSLWAAAHQKKRNTDDDISKRVSRLHQQQDRCECNRIPGSCWSTMRRGSESIVSGYQFDPVGIEWPAGFFLTLWTRSSRLGSWI